MMAQHKNKLKFLSSDIWFLNVVVELPTKDPILVVNVSRGRVSSLFIKLKDWALIKGSDSFAKHLSHFRLSFATKS